MSLQDLKTRTSADWLAYLLGRTPSRQAVTTATPAPRTPFGGNPEMTKEAHYLYDPATQTYTWTQPKPQEGAAPAQRDSQGSEGLTALADVGTAPGAGQGLSTRGQTIAAKALGLAQSPLGYLSPLARLAGVAGGAYLDNQISGIDRGYQVMGTAPNYGMGTIADINGNISTYSSPATLAAYDRDVFGVDAPAASLGAADYFGGGYSGEGFSGLGAGAEGPSNTVSASDLDSGHESDRGQGFFARGGIAALAAGGPVQEMSQQNQQLTLLANGGQQFAAGGISHLGDYSDGGRLLKGPGDGVSDSIPATIADKRPARLADGEFVVPARIVSELGNGSTEAGARKLYAMMDRIQKARGKTVGKDKVAVNSRADKALPA